MTDAASVQQVLLVKTIEAIEVVQEMETKIVHLEQTVQSHSGLLQELPIGMLQDLPIKVTRLEEQTVQLHETFRRLEALLKEKILSEKEASEAETTGRYHVRAVRIAGGLTLAGALLTPIWNGLMLAWQWLSKRYPPIP